MRERLFSSFLIFMLFVVSSITFWAFEKNRKTVKGGPAAVTAVLFVKGNVCPAGFDPVAWGADSYIRFKDNGNTDQTAATSSSSAGDHGHGSGGAHGGHSIANNNVASRSGANVYNSGTADSDGAHTHPNAGAHTHTVDIPYLNVRACTWAIN